MNKSRRLIAAILLIGSLALSTSYAATDAYYDEASFQFALNAFTLVNLDAPPFDAFSASYNVQDAGPAAEFLAAGISSFGANHQVQSGNAFQILKSGRDRLISNGSGLGVGDMIINFSGSVNGIGAWTNFHPDFGGDGGEIIAYDSIGVEIGRVAFGQSPATAGGFSGLISDQDIASAEITCTFDSDLKCGVYDIQLGTSTLPAASIPMVSFLAWIVMLGSLTLIGIRQVRERVRLR